jgi:VanZ family protein
MSLSQHRVSEWRHKVFIGYVAVMVLVFLLPAPTTPLAESRHVDKLVHFGIFLGFALLFYIDRHWRAWWTFLIAVVFAGGIELVQWILPYREGDWVDFGAGVAGAGLGAILVLLMERQAGRVAARSAQSGEDSARAEWWEEREHRRK